MNTTSLRGIFAEPKPVYRRNFIKENVRQIKQIQGIIQSSIRGSDPNLNKNGRKREDKFRTLPQKQVESKNKSSLALSKFTDQNLKIDTKNDNISKIQDKNKYTSRGMQTERIDDISRLYETGVIKYASAGTNRVSFPKKDITAENKRDHGDSIAAEGFLDVGDNAKNIKNIKPRPGKIDDRSKDPLQPPPTYQMGVVPKYIKERKGYEAKAENIEPDCPAGHILLPEEERKETLRVLRQSYADRVQELNCLPVRSDTLKMRKRKMELEEELKKIDEGIKVFQRPKVFVKINA